MAFNSANLVFSTWWVPPQGRYRMWDYDAGSDNISTVEGSNYFATGDGAKILRPTDIVRVTASDGNALYVVDDSSANPSSPTASIKKLAAGVTSFPT